MAIVLVAILAVGETQENLNHVRTILQAWDEVSRKYVVGEWRVRRVGRREEKNGGLVQSENALYICKITRDGYVCENFDQDNSSLSVEGFYSGKYYYMLHGKKPQSLSITMLAPYAELGPQLAKYKRSWHKGTTHPGLFSVHFTPWPELLRNPAFRVLRSEERSSNGQTTLRLHFELALVAEAEQKTEHEDESEIPTIRNAWIDLLPHYYYLPLAWRMEVKYSYFPDFWTIEWELQYDFGQGEIPLVKKDGGRAEGMDEGVAVTDTLLQEYEYITVGRYAPSESITLTAYGFPEPTWARGPRTPWWLWTSIAAVVLAIIGGIALRVAQRAR